MPEIKLSQTQKLSQAQIMKLSQQQIMAMNLIAMGNMELREEIYKKVDENPALEIVRDKFAEGAAELRQGNKTSGREKSSVHEGNVSKAGTEAAQTFQEMLENAPDKTETLQAHLLHQLNMTNLAENENRICRKLIENLDGNGWHILAPVTLLEKDKDDSEELLEKCLKIVQKFDPEGTCCENFTESLKVQAELRGNAPNLALFLLDGNLEMLKPPVAEKVQKKILDFMAAQEKLAFNNARFVFTKKDLDEEKIQEAIKFIQSLDPFPARDYGSDGMQFVQPDVYVERLADGGVKVQMTRNITPEIKIADDFEEAASMNDASAGTSKDFVQLQLKNAKAFIETLEFRENVLEKAFVALAGIQKAFFEKGPGNLVPLTQRKFAETIQVHESTVSRMADSKFIRCEWGTFPVKYFFSGAVGAGGNAKNGATDSASSDGKSVEQTAGGSENIFSTDSVKLEIEKILKAQKPGEKRLSDQKISDMLAEKGIKIARRTVAKYRTQMEIGSSFER